MQAVIALCEVNKPDVYFSSTEFCGSATQRKETLQCETLPRVVIIALNTAKPVYNEQVGAAKSLRKSF